MITSNIQPEVFALTEQLAQAVGSLRRPPVILCIGSDRVTGDCIGPLVGHMLTSRGCDCAVLGTLSSPVTALNLADTASTMRRTYAGRKVIAVDSCVGDAGELGKIKVSRGSLRPGLACGKKLPRVGDVSITATVAVGKAESLYSVRLGFVYSLASQIADAIAELTLGVKQKNSAKKSPDYYTTMP